MKTAIRKCLCCIPGVNYLLNRKKKKEVDEREVFKILLLTNRDSDNVGDQVIEACDICLLSAVMKNLGIEEERYRINSRAASIISAKYMLDRNPDDLKACRKAVSQSDLVIFGGAPVFNYLYQNFYERTAVTLEIAEEYHVPVIFSAVGIESYDEKNEKCQRLKKTLNFSCVRQITTRDGIRLLEKYIENGGATVAKVSDPAVFSSRIFEAYKVKRSEGSKKKIGIFILRAEGFVDNKIDFTKEDAANFWTELIRELENRGYDYNLLTSGHFSDEAFMDYLIRQYGVKEKKCVFNMNTPEKLVQKISSFDAVISCRLHPSIISFALDIPSLGLVWNTKVKGFYESIGYEDRILETEGISPERVVDRLEQAMDQGIDKNDKYLFSVYETMFHAIRDVVYPGGSYMVPYTYVELMENIPVYAGTTSKEKEEKLKRKFRRTYNSFNNYAEKNDYYKKEINKLKNKITKLEREKER